ncbi:MAG: Flp/Fap pilin component [Planctomycetota bacterium]|jgi:pilus assembly protein Flp/PilA
MKRLKKVFKELLVDEQGAALVEYGLLVALIALVALAAIEVVGGGISRLFEQVGAKLPAAPAGG